MDFELPENSGVYIFKDASFVPIYIGKASNIKKRVKNHFDLRSSDPKEILLIDRVKNIESIKVDSEIEALILEAHLIKRYRPVFNSRLKDDKDYLYIKITNEPFPKVLAARKRGLKNTIDFFGPFPSASRVRTTLKTLRRIFPYSNCKPNQKRPCLHYHIGLCPGVCAGLITKGQYRSNIKKISLFLKGEKDKVLNTLEKELKGATKKLEFETASHIKNQLESINYITKPVRTFEYLDLDIEEIKKEELATLAKTLDIPRSPKRIECYDISNIGGKDATGSMVVFNDGVADHDQYRRFKIKQVEGINDPAMLSEVLARRLQNDWLRPDLIVIDGGRGQLNAALGVITRFKLSIPVISLAKRLEEIYTPDKKEPLRLSRNNSALKLIQRVRDEAHRFAISYHRKLRSKRFLTGNDLFAKVKSNEKKTS